MTDVLVTENIVGDALDVLRRDFDVVFEPDAWRQPQRLRELIAGPRALIVRNQTQVTAELLQAATRLQIVARAGAGLDNVETSSATAAGIVVSYTPHENSLSVAELTLGLMLALARKIPLADRDTKTGGWDRRAFTGIELHEKVLGIVGLGRIGRLTAARARAFGRRIRRYTSRDDAPPDDPDRPLTARGQCEPFAPVPLHFAPTSRVLLGRGHPNRLRLFCSSATSLPPQRVLKNSADSESNCN